MDGKAAAKWTNLNEIEAGPFPPLVKSNQLRNISHAFNSAAIAEPGSG